ncbi:MAG TPA: HDOD domain-containing protein [Steroidobacteraceae bacterium]|nr:HDOD domain-containing protein [Steroidobacteraceae bacterium]
MIWFLSLLLVAACALAARPALRRVVAFGAARAKGAGEIEVEGEAPFDLRRMPEPPVLQAAAVQALDGAKAFRWLRELELGLDVRARDERPDDPAHERIVAAALAAVGDPASQKQYFPRRPNLLPELIRAINDENASVRQLVAIVARDPSLVGNLLRVANSSYYRVTPQPIETIERAIVVLGNDGLRSVTAAALMQPIFQTSGAAGAARFPELVWDHAVRSAHAAIPHAALVERANPFAAELLCLVSGLAEIVLFRAVLEQCPASAERDAVGPPVIASILDSHAPRFAWHIGADWRLSGEMLAALEEQMAASEPATPLGRSLRFGRFAGALAVLHTNSIVNAESVRASLPPSGLSPAHLESMLKRLLRPHEDPRTAAEAASR